MTRRRLAVLAPFAAALALVATGCGGSSDDDSPGSDQPTTTMETHTTPTETNETDTKTTEG